MAKVVSLENFKVEQGVHISGEAICLQCNHEWVAVAPAGCYAELECGECGLLRGVMKATCSPDEVWPCNCGCDLFRISPAGTVCINCGKYHYFDEDEADH